MKKYYFLNTLAYECVVSVEDKVVRCLHESNQVSFPHDAENGHTSSEAARQFLRRVEDDSSWEVLEGVTSVEEVLEPKSASEDMVEIVASIDENEMVIFDLALEPEVEIDPVQSM